MCKTDFPWTRDKAPSDQRRPRRRVMYLAEGPFPYKRSLLIQHSENTVYLCYFQAFLHVRRRQDPCYALCGHRFSAARRSDHEQVMPARHSDLCRPFHIFLSLDIRKVRQHLSPFRLNCLLDLRPVHCSLLILSPENLHNFGKASRPDHFHAFYKRSLCHVFLRYNAPAYPCPFSFHYNGKYPRHFPHSSVKPQFSCDQASLCRRRTDLPQGSQNRRCNRQVKRCSPLPQSRGRQIDDRTLRRIIKPGIPDRCPHALARFFYL